VNLKKQSLKNTVERFTIALEPTGAESGALQLMWENTMLSVGVSVKKNPN